MERMHVPRFPRKLQEPVLIIPRHQTKTITKLFKGNRDACKLDVYSTVILTPSGVFSKLNLTNNAFSQSRSVASQSLRNTSYTTFPPFLSPSH